jgi:uncharacterized protein (UPF0332 family)
VNEEVHLFLNKADHALEVAVTLLNAGHHADASSKVYYAMFYATQALLKAEGIDVTKHSAVESAFGYHFVKPGRISAQLHKNLIDARRIREIADYDISEEIVEPTGRIKYEEGVVFVRFIRAYIDGNYPFPN